MVAIGAVLAALALAAVLMFGGNGSAYTVSATFENAGQLVKGNQVEVGGQSGKYPHVTRDPWAAA